MATSPDCVINVTNPFLHVVPTGNEVYEFDLSGLGAGSHVFILTVDDGFGGSLMKIYPFSVGTGNCQHHKLASLDSH